MLYICMMEDEGSIYRLNGIRSEILIQILRDTYITVLWPKDVLQSLRNHRSHLAASGDQFHENKNVYPVNIYLYDSSTRLSRYIHILPLLLFVHFFFSSTVQARPIKP